MPSLTLIDQFSGSQYGVVCTSKTSLRERAVSLRILPKCEDLQHHPLVIRVLSDNGNSLINVLDFDWLESDASFPNGKQKHHTVILSLEGPLLSKNFMVWESKSLTMMEKLRRGAFQQETLTSLDQFLSGGEDQMLVIPGHQPPSRLVENLALLTRSFEGKPWPAILDLRSSCLSEKHLPTLLSFLEQDSLSLMIITDTPVTANLIWMRSLKSLRQLTKLIFIPKFLHCFTTTGPLIPDQKDMCDLIQQIEKRPWTMPSFFESSSHKCHLKFLVSRVHELALSDRTDTLMVLQNIVTLHAAFYSFLEVFPKKLSTDAEKLEPPSWFSGFFS